MRGAPPRDPGAGLFVGWRAPGSGSPDGARYWTFMGRVLHEKPPATSVAEIMALGE